LLTRAVLRRKAGLDSATPPLVAATDEKGRP